MPELPDVECYRACLRQRLAGRTLVGVRIVSPFVLRTFDPPVEALVGRRVLDVGRIGKRLVLEFEAPPGEVELFAVIHLMIAGRLRWLAAAARPPARITLATLGFENGVLALTEAGTRKRAALHVVAGRAALAAHDPGGIELDACPPEEFFARLRRASHTLKRCLTDPRLFSGIGNAYADEILHAAGLSPILTTSKVTPPQAERLLFAARGLLGEWTRRLADRFRERFPGPGDITAFRPEFAVHGRFGHACPVCGAPVQRIRYAENETNYCPGCQTGGRILADRSLSRLLKDDWPRTLEQLEG